MPASARLYPPCQAIYCSPPTNDTVTYSVTDPISGNPVSQTWTLTKGDERYIDTLYSDQGILTWSARYRTAGEAYFTYEVHYRIYDPSRGAWMGGSWGPFAGYSTWLSQHQVKDGVIAWVSHRALGASPAAQREYCVFFAAYDPIFGSWVAGNQGWWVNSDSKLSPELLRVKNGVVAWPMNDAGSGKADEEDHVDVYCGIYDYEWHQWMPYQFRWEGGALYGFDWIEIHEDTVAVELHYSDYWGFGTSKFHQYNPSTHSWEPSNLELTPNRRAFFIQSHTSGVVPFRVWFWDCSYALDGVSNPSVWDWTFAPGQPGADRSPSFLYTDPGDFTPSEAVNYEGGFYLYPAEGFQIHALPPAPSGGIGINNGATYTTSANVTLSLTYGSTATQMCFRQSPGLAAWSTWKPVAPSTNFSLNTLFVDGQRVVSVKYRDQYGTESQIYQASIILDITPPAAILSLNDGATTTNNPTVKVAWSASDALGIARMSYTSFDQEDPFYTWTTINFTPPVLNYRPKSTAIKFSPKPGTKTVMVRFTDVAGNVTHAQASIQLKTGSLAFLPLLLGD
jgi:hypothetical protein